MDEFCGWTNRSKRQRKRESGEITRIDPTGARKNRRALGRHPNLMEEIARVYTSIEGKLTKVEYGR